ncbi:hypothetical protein L0U85_10180 [Glycomyces sp. L485]|uniref:hypothetical protein n=1 Tax=Glycomyces sp. L485 TaxID=2909235 RepID=UPI001F4BCADA|nr:hypothetical protein [Glycomyces sp. L485]MCH7231216.1 hypothetical protein [Glycomyces sp. L485]
MPSSQRSRTVVALVLLACAAVFIAVALSQWIYGAGLDPRDDYGSRAAGIEFTDTARSTLFSFVPVAAPALAVFLRPGRVIRRLARIAYAFYIVIGVLLALSAALYGYDDATQLASLGRVWIDDRAATERLLLDGVWLVLAGVGLMSVRWNRIQEKSSIVPQEKQDPPKE